MLYTLRLTGIDHSIGYRGAKCKLLETDKRSMLIERGMYHV